MPGQRGRKALRARNSRDCSYPGPAARSGRGRAASRLADGDLRAGPCFPPGCGSVGNGGSAAAVPGKGCEGRSPGPHRGSAGLSPPPLGGWCRSVEEEPLGCFRPLHWFRCRPSGEGMHLTLTLLPGSPGSGIGAWRGAVNTRVLEGIAAAFTRPPAFPRRRTGRSCYPALAGWVLLCLGLSRPEVTAHCSKCFFPLEDLPDLVSLTIFS